MTNHQYDTIIIGAGSMGAGTCYELARRGQKVLGIDQFDPPHHRASHAGQSRIVRKAYFEHPDYVPLLERAYRGWRDLETSTGSSLYHRTGIVYFGTPGNSNIAGIRQSAALHNIPIQNLDATEARSRFPQFAMPPDFTAIWEDDAGFVTPEAAIASYLAEAEKLGASILRNTPVLRWRLEGNRVRVTTASGEFTGDKLIVTAGAWAAHLLPELNIPLQVTRQLLAWFAPPDPTIFPREHFPCWFVEDPLLGTFYGFPLSSDAGGPPGIKVAHHFPGMPCNPEAIDGPEPDAEVDKLRRFLRQYLPSAGEQLVGTKYCLYTYSPDSHFIIDHLPGYNGRVTVACGFSGHGFKFVPVVAEVLADLAVNGKTVLPIELFRATGRTGL